MKVAKLLSVLLLGLFLSTTAHAKDLKIAYVELGNVFNNYQKTKDFDAVLQKETQAAQSQIDDKVKNIRDEQSKLALMKDDEKQKLQATIEKEANDLRDFQKQKRAELSKKFEDMRKEIILEIEKIVSDMAKKDNYNYIFNDTVLLYGDQESNVTKTVLDTLNAGYKK
ncbi:MAG: OmpH family outer membrane protein [Candidatus Omnitrophica bacterium]|nr:OmpH family outer membrane protein [Candidatus Omnitrophota bacterium]